MSSGGVSDQMKVSGNSAKHNEERNIPWSQQVEEASFENLTSPNDDNFVGNHNLTQFQYPPFNAKENQNVTWSNFKTRKSSNNSEFKKYGKSSYYNNSKRDDSQPNAWSTINSKKNVSDSIGHFIRYNKDNQEFMSGRLDNRPSVIPIEEKKSNITPISTAPKKTTWASIASQPAKLTLRTTFISSSHKKKGPGMPPPPMVPGKHNLDVTTWDVPNSNPPPVPSPPPPILTYTKINVESSSKIGFEQDYKTHIEKGHKEVEVSKDDNESTYICNVVRTKNSPNGHSRKSWSSQNSLHQSRHGGSLNSRMPTRCEINTNAGSIRYIDRKLPYIGFNNISNELREESVHIIEQTSIINESSSDSPQAVLDELRDKNNYNPANIDLEKAAVARFFVIKSYSEDDIHRSIKYEIWCSTDHGNKRLDDAFKERQKEGGNVLLFFSVNGSGHFCGMAQMMTPVDYNSTSSVWSQDKWKGKFKVKWIYVKDVHNNKLRHILLENNENKSVTYSRDTQEVPNAKGIEVLQILHSFQHKTSIFDDFYHYEKKQEEELSSKKPLIHEYNNLSQNNSPNNRHNNRQSEEYRASGTSKYFNINSGSSFRNNSQRNSNYHNYNEHRRYDSHRVCSTTDFQHRDRDIDTDREGSEYSNRYQLKFDCNRRDERTQSKQNNRERDFSNENHNKNDMRYRSIKEMQKDNDYPITDRIRGTDY